MVTYLMCIIPSQWHYPIGKLKTASVVFRLLKILVLTNVLSVYDLLTL